MRSDAFSGEAPPPRIPPAEDVVHTGGLRPPDPLAGGVAPCTRTFRKASSPLFGEGGQGATAPCGARGGAPQKSAANYEAVCKRPRLLSKVCGLTGEEDLLLCHELGVDFTGFIFAPQSPRRISPEAAAALPKGRSKRVGVFAGASLEEIHRTAKLAALDYIQLHGGESPVFCRSLGPERIIKTVWPATLSAAELQKTLDRFAPVCAYFLFDAGKQGGGSGKALDWAAFRSLESPRPWLLAGGLGPQNLAAALAACAPQGVDMNSALESAPGRKNHDLLRQAIAILDGCRP